MCKYSVISHHPQRILAKREARSRALSHAYITAGTDGATVPVTTRTPSRAFCALKKYDFQKNRPESGLNTSEFPPSVCASGAILGFICFLTPDESCSSDQPPDMTMAMGGQARGGALCSTFFHPQLPTEVAAQQISCPRRPIRAPRHAAATSNVRSK